MSATHPSTAPRRHSGSKPRGRSRVAQARQSSLSGVMCAEAVVLTGPYRLFMFMSDCVEPHHVHVEGNEGLAKFWLKPVSIAENVGYSPREIHRIRMVVALQRALLIRAIDKVCDRARQ